MAQIIVRAGAVKRGDLRRERDFCEGGITDAEFGAPAAAQARGGAGAARGAAAGGLTTYCGGSLAGAGDRRHEARCPAVIAVGGEGS